MVRPRGVPATRDATFVMPADMKPTETKTFEADVSRLLHLMVHSVYSDRDVFLRELISNAADACEKLRYEAIEPPRAARRRPEAAHHHPRRCGQQAAHRRGQRHRHGPRRDGGGAGHDRALGHARLPGAPQLARQATTPEFIGQFGSRLLLRLHGRRPRRRRHAAWPAATRPGAGRPTARANTRSGRLRLPDAPKRGTRVVLHLMDDATSYTEPYTSGTAGQIAVRPCAGADLDRREAGRGGQGASPTARRFGRGRKPRSSPRSTPISTAASPGSMTSRR